MAAVAVLSGCASQGAGPSASPDPVTGTIQVSAAASLTETFKDVGVAFSRQAPGGAGPVQLRRQQHSGRPAAEWGAGRHIRVGRPTQHAAPGGCGARHWHAERDFAANRLEIVVAKGNPKHVRALSDLGASGLAVVLCAPTVPCGAYAAQALARAGATVKAVSQEQDVKAVVAKVELGEADAGIVYATDVIAAGLLVTGVGIPPAQNVTARYPVVELKQAGNPAGARALIAFLLSADGRAILLRHGFAAP